VWRFNNNSNSISYEACKKRKEKGREVKKEILIPVQKSLGEVRTFCGEFPPKGCLE
jgi:hypothetical protein